MAESDNQNTVGKWPWDGQKEKLTATVQAEIVKNLALYANQAAYCKPEEVGMSGSLDAVFLGYCFVAKEYFRKKAKTTPQASKIVDEAIQQIDRLYRWVSKPDDSFMVLLNEWDSLLQRFDMCMGSVQQVEKASETKQNATPAKIINIENFKGVLGDVHAKNVQTGDYASIHKHPVTAEKKKGIIEKLLEILGFIIPFVRKILWPK